MSGRTDLAPASPLARALLIELGGGPPHDPWYAADLAQAVGANIAQVVAALGGLERDGLVAAADPAPPWFGRFLYRATDEGRRRARQIANEAVATASWPPRRLEVGFRRRPDREPRPFLRPALDALRRRRGPR